MSDLDLKYSVDERVSAFQEHERGLLVSLAGPGTGKTYSLLKRVASLSARGHNSQAVCYLTFIRAIANAFIVDYIDEFGEDAYEADKPRISTLHSFGCRLLRNQGFRIGYDGELYFLNAAAKESDAATTLLGDLIIVASQEECGTVAKMRASMTIIKAAWQDQRVPGALNDPLPAVAETALTLFKAYRTMDWDLAVRLAGELLEDQDVNPSWITDIDHYLVDEYQDFNAAEQAFISLLCDRATSVVVVGDDDQSLYMARGGSPEGMRSLYAESSADTVSLVKNYRCRGVIVDAANKFQAAMCEVPRPTVAAKDGGRILCFGFKSSKTEVQYLAGVLTKCIDQTPDDAHPKEGTVCLFTTHKAMNSYHAALCDSVPIVRRSAPAMESREWLSRLLQLVQRPDQRFLQRLLVDKFADLKPRHKKLMIGLILERDISPYEAIGTLADEGRLNERAVAAAGHFRAVCDSARSPEESTFVPLVASITGLESDRLFGPISQFLGGLGNADEEKSIAEVCDSVLPESALPSESPKQILFLTMHGAKGLTRKFVFMPGLERAWLPGVATGEDLREKRRLFYVALTRATDGVVITYPYHRAAGDALNYGAPGRGEGCPLVDDAGLSFVYHR